MRYKTSVHNITLLGLSSVPVKAHKALLGRLFVICLLTDSVFCSVSCDSAGPFSDSTQVSTTLFIPEIHILNTNPTKAPYEGYGNISRLDIFVFNDDGTRKLDSYSSIGRPETAYVTVTSSAGDKLVVILANCGGKTFTSDEFYNYDALGNVRWRLEDEDPDRPVMSGECRISAGGDGYTPVRLTPVMADICLDFIRCDFSGRGYRSNTLLNACAYLTNLSGSSEIMRQNGFHITELENEGRLDEAYLSRMKHPEMIYRTFKPSQWSPINLHCYPNDGGDGLLGNPRTRLVIQGDIDGTTYYYPIEINREGFGYTTGQPGIGRNIKYSYGLTITRKGSLDPDTLIGPDDIVEQGWIKLNPGNFITGTVGQKVHIWCDVYPEGTPVDICREDLDYDVGRGIYTYEMDSDGHGVTLTFRDGGSGMFTIDAGPPVNDGFLVVVIVDP